VSSNEQFRAHGGEENLPRGNRLTHSKTATPRPLSASTNAGKRQLPPVTEKGNAALVHGPSDKRNVSDTLKANPFVQADNRQKALALAPKVLPQHAWARRPTELSDCLPQRHMDRSVSDSTTPEDCENRSCKASSKDMRHSVKCTSRRKALRQLASRDWNADRYVHERVRHSQHAPLPDPLQTKIDQLYHHSDNLYRSQHIMEHLAAGTRVLPEPIDTGQGSSPSTQPDARLHSLAADEEEVAEALGQDHSLHADELFQEAESASIHSLVDDRSIRRELSPMSLGTLEEAHLPQVRSTSPATGIMLSPTQDINRFRTDTAML
jgi:hypothetical protein